MQYDDEEYVKPDIILSDPSFDVEKFLYCLNLHEKNPSLLSTLMNDPSLLFYIAESPYHEVLSNNVNSAFDPKIFEKMHQEMGLEVWEKKTQHDGGNIWYGVIVNEKLAILYTRVRYVYDMVAYQGEAEVKEALKVWKSSLKMRKAGDPVKKVLAPGERPIDLIRKAILEDIVALGYADSYCYRRRRGAINSHMEFWSPGNHRNYDDPNKLILNVNINGNKVKIIHQVLKKTKGNYGWYSDYSTGGELVVDRKISDGVYKDPETVATEVIQWLATQDTTFDKHVKKLQLLTAAGVEI